MKVTEASLGYNKLWRKQKSSLKNRKTALSFDFAKANKVSVGYLKKLFEVLRSYSADPMTDLLRLWDICVFNYLIGNTDNHLEEKYEKDFVVLSRTEHYDSYFETLQMVEYEIQCKQDVEDTFTAIDRHDGGMAGWNATDKYRSE